MARVILSPDNVPDGFVRLTDITSIEAEKTLMSKWQCEGKLDAVKLMLSSEHRTGPLWVNKQQALSLLEKHRNPPSVAPATPSKADNVHFDSLLSVLGRIADALENLATLPR